MKALTIRQPYPYYICLPSRNELRKRVENRTRATNYRGAIYIHAGMSRAFLKPRAFTDELGNEWFRDSDGNVIPVRLLAFGAVVAIAKLIDCVSYADVESGACDEQYPWIRGHAHASGPWCWVLDSVSPIGPWPYKGKLGLFNIEDAELDAIANRVLEVPTP